MQPILLPGEEEKRRNNSLPNPGLISSLSIPTADLVVGGEIGAAAVAAAGEDPSHTRNSSTTSQASAGYSSQNSQPAHSRQSSSGGESSHGR